MDVDFLLVGQGIAGTALSYRLINSGQSVYVIDQAAENNCSRVAAGLYNPLTGRRMVKTWNADQLFPEIAPFYSALEKTLQARFKYELPVYRPFVSIEEQNEWMGRSGEEEFKSYIQAVRQTSAYQEVNNDFGGVVLNQSGYIDLNTMLDAFTGWLGKNGGISDEAFDENLLRVSSDGISYKNISARNLVYTNGLGALKSQYFHWVPLKPNKGELLIIDQDFAPSEIINRGVFRITLPNQNIKVGSTYSPNEVSSEPTQGARNELLEKLGKLIHVPVKGILEHKTGIRPTMDDRRPVLGNHPHFSNIYIFNGLGSKGVSLAPYYSKIMRDLLIYNKEPPKEVNISRFFKYI